MFSLKTPTILDSIIKGCIVFVLLYSLAGFLICYVTLGTNPIGAEGLIATPLTIVAGGLLLLKGHLPNLSRMQIIACGLSVANAVML